MEVLQGRPTDETGRLEKEIAVYDLLDKLDIPFRRVDHVHADTMEMCQEIDQALGQDICKNLFLCNRQKTKFYLLLMPGDKPFKTKDLLRPDRLQPSLLRRRRGYGTAAQPDPRLRHCPGTDVRPGLPGDAAHRPRFVPAERLRLPPLYQHLHRPVQHC